MFISFFYVSCAHGLKFQNICRAFRDILKTDRETYGVGEDYEIVDLVADEWQEQVDNVVGGILQQRVN